MFRKLAPALVASLLVVAACATEADDATVEVRTGPAATSALQAAPAAAADAGTAAFEMSMDMAMGDESFQLTGHGAFDSEQQRSTTQIDMGAAGFDEPMELIVDGSTTYMRSPLFDVLGGDDTWLSLSPDDLGGPSADLGLGAASFDPSKILESLRGVTGEPEAVGTEQVRGVETTRYTAHVDLASALEDVPADQRDAVEEQFGQIGTEALTVDVWLDADGLVRRLQMDMGGLFGGTALLTIELFDYGQPVDIEVPPADEVRSLTDGLGLFGTTADEAS